MVASFAFPVAKPLPKFVKIDICWSQFVAGIFLFAVAFVLGVWQIQRVFKAEKVVHEDRNFADAEAKGSITF